MPLIVTPPTSVSTTDKVPGERSNFLLLGRHDDLQTLLLLSSHSCHLLIRKPRQCRVLHNIKHVGGFPGGSDGKASARNVGDPGSIPGSGRSPGEGNGNPLQYSCLENSMDGGAWWATVHGVAKSRTRPSDLTKHVGARSTSSNVSWISDMVKFCPQLQSAQIIFEPAKSKRRRLGQGKSRKRV